MVHQNSASSSFLKLCVWNLKPFQWTFLSLLQSIISSCILITVAMKSGSPVPPAPFSFHHLACWVDYFTMHDSATVENIGSYLFKCSHIWSFNIKKSHLFVAPPSLLEKSLSVKKLASSWWWIQAFQNSNFHLKISLATNTVSHFLWSDRLTHFHMIFPRYLDLNSHSLPLFCIFK